jgi:hypothetical protein
MHDITNGHMGLEMNAAGCQDPEALWHVCEGLWSPRLTLPVMASALTAEVSAHTLTSNSVLLTNASDASCCCGCACTLAYGSQTPVRPTGVVVVHALLHTVHKHQ